MNKQTQENKSNIIVANFGRKGTGKTYLTANVLIEQFPRVVILDSMQEYNYYPVYSIDDFVNALEANVDRKFFRVSYRPKDRRAADFFRVVKNINNITIVVEEAGKYTSANYIDPNFEDIIQYGRHYNQNLIVISRRPSEISRHISAQADIIITFQTNEPRDLDYFKKYMENPEELKTLQRGEYKVVLGEDEMLEVFKKK